MDKRRVLLSVTVVPERDNLELTEAGRQVRNGRNTDANFVPPHSFAVMEAILIKQLFDLQIGHCHCVSSGRRSWRNSTFPGLIEDTVSPA
jgi:hypothetical protein